MTRSDETVDPVMRGFGVFRFGEATLHLAACLRDGKGLDGSEACGAWLTLLAKRAYEDGWREAHRVRAFEPGPEPLACLLCGTTFTPGNGRRADAKFCSDAHRTKFNSLKRSRRGAA